MNRSATSSTIVLNWFHVALIVAAIVGEGAIALRQLRDISGTLREVQGAQQANSTQVALIDREVERFDSRLTRLEEGIEGEEVAKVKREALESKLNFKIDEINTRLVTAENRLGTLRKNMDTHDHERGRIDQ